MKKKNVENASEEFQKDYNLYFVSFIHGDFGEIVQRFRTADRRHQLE